VHGGKSGKGCFDGDSRRGEKRPTSSRACDGESVMDKRMTGSVGVHERPTQRENDCQKGEDVSVTNEGED
jgi:hypothetical protein